MVICICGCNLKNITKKHLESKIHKKLVLEQSNSFKNLEEEINEKFDKYLKRKIGD